MMVLAVAIVLGGFGLLYLAVANEERQMSKSTRSQRR
jgi:hypothetical protein